MVLVQRKKQLSDEDGTSNSTSTGGRSGKGGNKIFYVLKKVIIAIIVAVGIYLFTETTSPVSHAGGGANVRIEYQRGDDGLVTLGPHSIVVDTDCVCARTNPPWARITGDALLHIPLTVTVNHRFYKGDFTVPIAGKYEVEIHWINYCACDTRGGTSESSGGNSTSKSEKERESVLQEPFVAVGSSKSISMNAGQGRAQVKKDTDGMFVESGAWIEHSRLLKSFPENKIEGESGNYMWADTSKIVQGKEVTSIGYEYHGYTKTLLKDGFVTDTNGFYKFQQLSNYELVCWLGSDSAKNTRDAFLSLRPKLFSSQRPFKFHYYESHSLINPDATWSEETKKKFRKCKHVLVSMDEPTELLSRSEYKTQMTNFLQHVMIAINDDTFPIWVLTNMESPMRTKNCFDSTPRSRPPSTLDHPCNEVLKEIPIFAHDDSDPSFHGRVRLLDNTDLSLPHFISNDEQRADIYTAVAMRIYIIVGYQVKKWRDKGQIGHINGLTRGDVEEPNFDLVPYDWSSELSTSMI